MSERPEGFEAEAEGASESAQPVSAQPDGSAESGVTDTVTPDSGEGQGRTSDSAESSDAEASRTEASETEASGAGTGEHSDTRLARERLEDLQRLQAEYVNYKRRVDRDRAVVQERAIADVIDTLLPVLDDIHAAREHGDLSDGPFAAIADKLEGSLGKFGLERFGAPGEAFDPAVHEALLHTQWDSAVTPADPSATTVVQVLQPGYRTGQRIIRPARVSVADPQ